MVLYTTKKKQPIYRMVERLPILIMPECPASLEGSISPKIRGIKSSAFPAWHDELIGLLIKRGWEILWKMVIWVFFYLWKMVISLFFTCEKLWCTGFLMRNPLPYPWRFLSKRMVFSCHVDCQRLKIFWKNLWNKYIWNRFVEGSPAKASNISTLMW